MWAQRGKTSGGRQNVEKGSALPGHPWGQEGPRGETATATLQGSVKSGMKQTAYWLESGILLVSVKMSNESGWVWFWGRCVCTLFSWWSSNALFWTTRLKRSKRKWPASLGQNSPPSVLITFQWSLFPVRPTELPTYTQRICLVSDGSWGLLVCALSPDADSNPHILLW